MFERELVDSLFVQRWSIVRTLMPQSIAEHTFLVAHYANDIASYLDLSPRIHLAILQYSLWHDAKDEIFTGDLPGPNKRGLLDAIGPEAKEAWDKKLREWADRTFEHLSLRSGIADKFSPTMSPSDLVVLLLVVKTADWLESAVRMATEAQMGNKNATRHITPNMNGAIETAMKLIDHIYGDEQSSPGAGLKTAIIDCVSQACHGASSGPWITREDEGRGYHDPCVDSAEDPQS